MNSSQNNLFNLHDIAQDYIKSMFSQVVGMKSIILDKETKVIFSLVATKSSAIKEEIFMFEDIENLKDQKMLNAKGIFLLRPTENNLNLLGNILANPNFSEIHLHFTNTVKDEYLKKIAAFDEFNSVKHIQETYLDYYIINSNFFHLNLESTLSLTGKMNDWKLYEHLTYTRIVEGILGVLISNRSNPIIKYVKGSDISNQIGHKILDYYNENQDLISRNCGRETNSILFIFDRKEDPITPLLTQWTYQAMIHEIFSIKNNIIEIIKENKIEKLVLSDFEDKFFKENLTNDFGDVASKIKDLAEKLAKEQNSISSKMERIEDVRKLLDKLPEKKKESAEITKHFNILSELTDVMQVRELLNISSLEQDMTISDSRTDHYNRLIPIIKNPKISPVDKIKLSMLFALRYEGDNYLKTIKTMLQENKMEEYLEYIDYILEFAGQSKRTCDVLSNKDFVSKAKQKMIQAFRNCPNVFTQHTSFISTIVEKIMKKGVNEREIETINPVSKEKFNKIFVFNFGGATYEELKDLMALGSKDCQIIYGGTYIHNSKSFLAELSQIKYVNQDKSNQNVILNIKN